MFHAAPEVLLLGIRVRMQLDDKGTIESLERNDIAHGAQGDDIQPLPQVRLGARVRIPSALTQAAVDSDDQKERDTDRGEVPEAA